jgi:hypothetical protein
MMTTFLRIEERGGSLVAVFDGGYRVHDFDHGTFCLDESNLRTRIANIEAGKAHPNRDASVERAALVEMVRQRKEQR